MNILPYGAGYAAGFIIAIVIVLAIALVIQIFYLLTLQNTLKACAPHNQRMSPQMVWLMLIPLFNYFWRFKVVQAVADSITAEYQMRNIPLDEERPGFQVGIAYCILYCSALIQYTGIPVIGQLLGFAGLICWIIYWVRIGRYKSTLQQSNNYFGVHNPNPYPFPNQFPGQPNMPYNPNQPNPYNNPNQPYNPNQSNPYGNPNQPYNPNQPNPYNNPNQPTNPNQP